MDEFLDKCDDIDCSVFSSDALADAELRKKFKQFLGRWAREIKSWEEMDEETTNEKIMY